MTQDRSLPLLRPCPQYLRWEVLFQTPLSALGGPLTFRGMPPSLASTQGPSACRANAAAAAPTRSKAANKSHQHPSQITKSEFWFPWLPARSCFPLRKIFKGTHQREITELQLQRSPPPVPTSGRARVSTQPAACQSDPLAGLGPIPRLRARARLFRLSLYR